MQALLSADLPCHIAAVISNRADAAGAGSRQQHGIATRVVSHRDYADRAAFDAALAQLIDSYQPDFVVLAGFMRILTAAVCEPLSRPPDQHPSFPAAGLCGDEYA